MWTTDNRESLRKTLLVSFLFQLWILLIKLKSSGWVINTCSTELSISLALLWLLTGKRLLCNMLCIDRWRWVGVWLFVFFGVSGLWGLYHTCFCSFHDNEKGILPLEFSTWPSSLTKWGVTLKDSIKVKEVQLFSIPWRELNYFSYGKFLLQAELELFFLFCFVFLR